MEELTPCLYLSNNNYINNNNNVYVKNYNFKDLFLYIFDH